jgi:hypothetical protein
MLFAGFQADLGTPDGRRVPETGPALSTAVAVRVYEPPPDAVEGRRSGLFDDQVGQYLFL